MKILHVITTINRGGAENHLFLLIKGLVDRGFNVSVAYLKGDGYWTNYYKEIGVNVYPLQLEFYGELRPLFLLKNLILKNNFDLIHAHLPPAEAYAYLAILLSRVKSKLVISKHNDEPFYKYKFSNLFSKIINKRATSIIAISKSVKKYFVDLKIIPKNKIVVIHYGYDLTSIYLANKFTISPFSKDNIFIIGTVARLVEQKALHILVKAFKKFTDSAGIDSKLVIIGEGPLKNDLIALSNKLKIRNQVEFIGYREDASLLMSHFDVFALTSIYEGFGLVLLEAMSQRRAIVASNVSAIPEIVIDQVTGLLVKPECVDGFCEAFLKMRDPKIRQDFGDAGFERMISNFCVSSMVEDTVKIYTL